MEMNRYGINSSVWICTSDREDFVPCSSLVNAHRLSLALLRGLQRGLTAFSKLPASHGTIQSTFRHRFS